MLRLPVRVAARAVRGPISARSMSSSHSPSEYCFNIVKKVDYENFLCLLLLKGSFIAFIKYTLTFHHLQPFHLLQH